MTSTLNQIGHELRQLLCAIRPAKFDGNVLALDITEVSKANPQRRNAIGPNRSGAKIQPTNCRDFFRLLRACRKRPGGRAANQSDEFAPPHRLTHPTASYASNMRAKRASIGTSKQK